jgi:hypothetical protein
MAGREMQLDNVANMVLVAREGCGQFKKNTESSKGNGQTSIF